MNSCDLDREGFGEWCQWLRFALEAREEALAQVPHLPGVYVVRYCRMFGRFKGESDIVYIGSGKGTGGLKARLKQYFSPGHRQSTNIRIRNLLGESSEFEFSIRRTATSDDARALEVELLKRYLQDHKELPPGNRSLTGI